MARNEDTSLPNRHVFVSAKTGGGKSQAMRNVVVPKSGIRAMFWDPDKDHYCNRFDNKGHYLKALSAAIASGKPFRIGWSGDDDQETFEWFCQAAWKVLDGDFDTWVVMEEMADMNLGQKLPPFFGKLLKRGRKYGGIIVTNSQRVQDVPKALITQSAVTYLGQQENHDAKYLERITGIPARTLENLQPLQFMKKTGGEVVQVKVPYVAYNAKKRTRNAFSK